MSFPLETDRAELSAEVRGVRWWRWQPILFAQRGDVRPLLFAIFTPDQNRSTWFVATTMCTVASVAVSTARNPAALARRSD